MEDDEGKVFKTKHYFSLQFYTQNFSLFIILYTIEWPISFCVSVSNEIFPFFAELTFCRHWETHRQFPDLFSSIKCGFLVPLKSNVETLEPILFTNHGRFKHLVKVVSLVGFKYIRTVIQSGSGVTDDLLFFLTITWLVLGTLPWLSWLGTPPLTSTFTLRAPSNHRGRVESDHK